MLFLLLLPIFLLFFCSSISYPQQRPAGESSPAGCHGEAFPASSRFASECEGGSCSCGSEFLPSPSYRVCHHGVFATCIKYLLILLFFWLFFLNLGQQKWTPVPRADGGSDGRAVSTSSLLWSLQMLWEGELTSSSYFSPLLFLFPFWSIRDGITDSLGAEQSKC